MARFRSFLLAFIGLAALCGGIFFFHTRPLPYQVVICGVCKNVSPFLPKTIASIEALGAKFRDYRVFIYENNSSDATVEQLRAWAERNPKVTITCENIPREELLSQGKSHTWDSLPFRTEAIARARNIVLQQALDAQYDDYEYLVMADLDLPHKWDIEGIMSSFYCTASWDALFSNGIDSKGHHYDRFALRDDKRPLGPELLGEPWWQDVYSHSVKIKRDAPLYPVYSAFGGLGIYKREAVRGCSYTGTVTPDLELLTQRLIALKGLEHPQIAQYAHRDSADLEVVRLSTDPSSIKWILNSGGHAFPVCCEHVTLHASMILHGHNKLFINPRMTMQY
jgi:hypothetical protein